MYAKTIVLFNHKGGVSKTTTTFNLAWALTAKGKKVLLVDGNPQCNLTGLLLGDQFDEYYSSESTMHDNIKDAVKVAFEGKPNPIQVIDCYTPASNNNLFLIPGHIDLSEYDATLSLSLYSNNIISTLQNLPGSFYQLITMCADKYNVDEENYMLTFIYRNIEKPLSYELYYALRGERFPTFKGMEKMFNVKIQKDTVFGHGVDDYNEQEIEVMVNAIIEKANGRKIVPIIIVPWDKNTANEHQSRMYYYIKYLFLKINTPCQFMDIAKIKNHNIFKWSISGVALQIFTKLGSSPWCLVPSTEKCPMIGIGQAHRKNTDGMIERYYSYSIQNDSSGLFRDIKLLSDNTDHDGYLNGLSKKLREIIFTQVDEFDCFVIHTPFRLRNDEINAVREVVGSLSRETNKKFAVLRFKDNHYYTGYDFGNDSLTPYESTFVSISAGSQYHRHSRWLEEAPLGTVKQ
jgi:hypothetical protein